MDQIKSALTSLEQSVLRLESAIYVAKKNQGQAQDKIKELKEALKTVYQRLDKAVSVYRQGGE